VWEVNLDQIAFLLSSTAPASLIIVGLISIIAEEDWGYETDTGVREIFWRISRE
jgi:hypothetical protein